MLLRKEEHSTEYAPSQNFSMTMSLALILCFRLQMPFETNQKLTAEGAFLALLH